MNNIGIVVLALLGISALGKKTAPVPDTGPSPVVPDKVPMPGAPPQESTPSVPPLGLDEDLDFKPVASALVSGTLDMWDSTKKPSELPALGYEWYYDTMEGWTQVLSVIGSSPMLRPQAQVIGGIIESLPAQIITQAASGFKNIPAGVASSAWVTVASPDWATFRMVKGSDLQAALDAGWLLGTIVAYDILPANGIPEWHGEAPPAKSKVMYLGELMYLDDLRIIAGKAAQALLDS